MKRSQISVAVALGVLVIVVVILAGAARLAVSQFVGDGDRPVSSGAAASTRYDLDGFRNVVIEDNWEIDLLQGDEWQVSLSYPERSADRVSVTVEGDRLVLGAGGSRRAGWGWWGNHDRFSARIVMPELNSVEVSGAADLDFSGFEDERLAITITGAGNVKGHDGSYDELALTVSGAANIDLRDVPVVDANVNLSGASNVRLDMAGGVLSGNLSGMGKVSYSGQVRNQRVSVSGFGRVNRDD